MCVSQSGFKEDSKDDLEEQIKIAHDKLEPSKETEKVPEEGPPPEPEAQLEPESKPEPEAEIEPVQSNLGEDEDSSDDDVVIKSVTRSESNNEREKNEEDEHGHEDEGDAAEETTSQDNDERTQPSTGDSGLDDTVHEDADDQVCDLDSDTPAVTLWAL